MKKLLALFVFILSLSATAIGDISDDDLYIIQTVGNDLNIHSSIVSSRADILDCNCLEITYSPVSTDVQTRQDALNFVVGFYVLIKTNFPDVDGCKYVETNGGRVVGTMYTSSEWLNGLTFKSRGELTTESLAFLTAKTGNTFQQNGQTYNQFSSNSKDYPGSKKPSSSKKSCIPDQATYDLCMKYKAESQAQLDEDIKSGSGSIIVGMAGASRNCDQYLCQ